MKIDLDELTRLRVEWHSLFDRMVKLIEDNNGCIMVQTPIYDYIRVSPGVRESMRLHNLRIVTDLLIDKHVRMEYINEHTGEVRRVLVSRAFEGKAFGDIRYTTDTFKSLVRILELTNNKESKIMAKVEKFKKGAFVSTVKFNGDKILGIYEHGYDNGTECCVSAADGKKYCVKLRSTKPATDEEEKIIQETIIKPRRAAEKALKKAQMEANEVEDEELTEEDLEAAAYGEETPVEENVREFVPGDR